MALMLGMSFAELVGSVGVFLLLTAFFLNLVGVMSVNGLAYICLNLSGAGLACYASYLVDFMPFVVLEGTWAVVAAFARGVFQIDFRFPAENMFCMGWEDRSQSERLVSVLPSRRSETRSGKDPRSRGAAPGQRCLHGVRALVSVDGALVQ